MITVQLGVNDKMHADEAVMDDVGIHLKHYFNHETRNNDGWVFYPWHKIEWVAYMNPGDVGRDS